MISYVMLCYVMLCNVMLCYVTLCNVVTNASLLITFTLCTIDLMIVFCVLIAYYY